MEFTRDGVYQYAFDGGRILLANQGLVDILDLDCTPEELRGQCLKDVLVYTEKEGSVRHALENEGRIHGFEYHFKTLKGEDRWVIHDSFLVTDPVTQQRIVEAIVKDITERKKAEHELAAEEERLRVTLRSIGDGVIATEAAGRIVLMNSVAEQLTGWPQEAALGLPLEDVFRIVNERSRRPCANPVEKVLQSGTVVGLANHTALIARDGTERSIADSGAPIRDRAGNIIGVVLVFRDITEQNRVEEELRKHRLHLEELVEQRTAELHGANEQLTREVAERRRAEETLSAAMADLERSNEELEQFAYVASHDLQEPLRKVASFTQLLAERCENQLDAEARKYIAFAVDGAHRMQNLISDLLCYSRVGSRGKPFAPVDGEAVLECALANLETAIQESGAVVTHERLPTVMGDAAQLIQLFQNLISNAIKYHGADAPRVHVSAARQDKEWIFQVRDNGIGIEPQYFDRLFVIFQRLHSRAKYPGTGIGLAISKKVVERHSGRIWVESAPGKGSTFFFSIPAGGSKT